MSELNKHYPRVLVVAGRPIDNQPVAVMMANLFRNWPLERIAQVHGGFTDPCPDMCPRHWRVSPADVPLDKAVRTLLGMGKKPPSGEAPDGSPAESGAAGYREFSRTRAAVHDTARSWADVLPFHLSEAFWDWVTEFRPDVIYATLGRIRLMNLVLQIADRLCKPVVPHIMDDWPTTHYRSSLLRAIPRRILLSRFRAVVRRSPVGMAICEAMGQEYQRRYGIRFEAFMNCVDTVGECPGPPSGRKNGPLKFLYVGGLHLNRWRSIQEVGKTLATLRDDGLKAEMVVYAPASDIARYAQTLAETPATRVGGSLAAEEVLPTIRAADVLLHVESFERKLRKRTRLSLSTKIPQYMSAGRPILGYGPAEVASCRYIQDCNCGRVVGSRDGAALAAAVKELASDAQLRAHLGRRGWEVASQRHNAESERNRFRQLLADVANGRGKWTVPRQMTTVPKTI